MSDAPDNLVPTMLRRIDGKLDRLSEDVQDLKRRMTSMERQMPDIRSDLAGMSARIDRLEIRIERRLDIVPA